MRNITRIEGAVFRDLDTRRRQARPKRTALASGLVAQALMSRSSAARDVPTSWGVRRASTGPEARSADAIRATARVY
jgi:hypothetical protein